MNVIGISGKIGSGKDTLANRFIKAYYKTSGIKFKNKKFGYKVKKLVSELTGLSMRVMLSRNGKLIYLEEWGMTVGELQQKMGTDAVRCNIHDDGWVLSLFSKYNPTKDFWIISDVRFINEADKIKNMGGVLIRLNGDPKNCRANDKRDMNHRSETELDNYDKWDYIYDNNSPIKLLDNFISKLISELPKYNI